MIVSMAKLRKQLRLIGTNAGIAIALALVGAALYIVFSINFANTQQATIDEGLFLYKGNLFASGIFQPFQSYGPHTEYGPLSYLIPGYIQLWFGPGLRTGRTFAIVVGVIALLGLWATARRLAGPWWATVGVWAAALNPAVIRFFSVGLSQGLVTCPLMWTLFFALGKERRIWQTSLSAVLAGLILLTRQDMAPVLPILLVYVFCQFGRKQGFITSLAGITIVIAGHAIFWPGILEMWAPWVPASLTPFLAAWRLPNGIKSALNFNANWSARIYSLLEGLRFHFVSLVGSIFSLVLWPSRKAWKSDALYRFSVFLGVLFFLLLGLHIWAGLGFNGINFNNAFAVNPYFAFLTYLGLLFSIAVFSNFQANLSIAKQIALSAFIIVISTCAGYGSFLSTSEFLLYIRIPRIRSFLMTGRILPGNVPIWDFLANKFGIAYDTSRWVIPTLTGILGGLLILMIGFAIRTFLKRKRFLKIYSFGAISIVVFMLAGVLFSPSIALGGGFNQWDCSGNTLANYEQAGKNLAGVIPPGSQVYWDGGNAVAVLLYVPNIEIHPQELDGQWNYWLDGDPATLSRLGHWNLALAEQWRQEADVIIIQQGYIDSNWQTFLNSGEYTEVLKTKEFLNCTPDSSLLVYLRRG
jgi:hypothetical protein